MEEFLGLVYRSGNLNSDAFTPRPGRDTIGRPGQAPGLSTFEILELATKPGDKAQVIDLALLQPPLKGLRDDPGQGGIQGHVSIVPTTHNGEVDTRRLEEWAATRQTGQTHPLTKIILDAVVKENVRRPG